MRGRTSSCFGLRPASGRLAPRAVAHRKGPHDENFRSHFAGAGASFALMGGPMTDTRAYAAFDAKSRSALTALVAVSRA